MYGTGSCRDRKKIFDRKKNLVRNRFVAAQMVWTQGPHLTLKTSQKSQTKKKKKKKKKTSNTNAHTRIIWTAFDAGKITKSLRKKKKKRKHRCTDTHDLDRI